MRKRQFNPSRLHEERGFPETSVRGVLQFTILAVSLATCMADMGQVKAQAVFQDPNSTKAVGDPDRGRQLYMKDGCFQCHGTEAQGGGYTGPKLAPPPPLSSLLLQLRRPSNEMPPFTENVLSDSEVEDVFAFLRSIPAVHLTPNQLMQRGNETESADVTFGSPSQLHSSGGKSVSPEKSRKTQVEARSTKTTAVGVYTTTQARNGKVQYIQHCAACHMASLSGNGKSPSLLGQAFSQVWNGHTVGELYDRMQSTMPQFNPHSLTSDQYIDILAYLFQVNNLPAGSEELKHEPNVLKDITISEEKGGRVGR